jgi:hypothetical protein
MDLYADKSQHPKQKKESAPKHSKEKGRGRIKRKE